MEENFAALARRYNFSLATVQTLAAALQASGGKLVQFNLPELGGMGQWMPGMTMTGDMFNASLKARVEGLCNELAGLVTKAPTPAESFKAAPETAGHWWASKLGAPASSGGQHDFAYAYFPTHHRLAIRQAGKVIYYDTGSHTISGVSQQQQTGRSAIVFSGPQGVIPVATLSVVDEA
jgi:hypothetical protein